MGHRGDEILRLTSTTREEIIEDLKIAIDRSSTKCVFGYESLDDAVESLSVSNRFSSYDRSVVMVLVAMGIPVIDDMNAPVTRKNGQTSSPLYELEQPFRWPPGLFERLSGLIWVIDRPINPLDIIVRNI